MLENLIVDEEEARGDRNVTSEGCCVNNGLNMQVTTKL